MDALIYLMVYSLNGNLFSHTKECNIDKCYIVGVA